MKSKSFIITKKAGFEKCLKALANCRCSVVSSDFSSGKIEAKKDGGLLSYGHQINLTIKSTEKGKLKISVTSNSTGIQVIDWGTNSDNETEVLEAISQLLK